MRTNCTPLPPPVGGSSCNDGGLGAADFDFFFGDVGDKPFTGDFTDNGQDTVGLHRESTGFVYYRNTLTTGNANNNFFFGDPGDQIITGRWAQNLNAGPDTVGIFRPSQGHFYLRFSNSQGNADVDFQYGNSNMSAVAGNFGALPGGDPAPPPPPTTSTSTTSTTSTTLPPICDPSYPDFCIPPPPPDLNCGDIAQKNFTVLQPDPHGFDGNKDGVGCES